VRKYHTMLHSVFEGALRDRVVAFNPRSHTELPKVIKKKARTLTPEQYVAILTALPVQRRSGLPGVLVRPVDTVERRRRLVPPVRPPLHRRTPGQPGVGPP